MKSLDKLYERVCKEKFDYKSEVRKIEREVFPKLDRLIKNTSYSKEILRIANTIVSTSGHKSNGLYKLARDFHTYDFGKDIKRAEINKFQKEANNLYLDYQSKIRKAQEAQTKDLTN